MRATILALAVTLVAVAGVCAPARARAQTYPPITDRDFALDAYQGATVASYRIVGMGGTSLATAEGAASMSSTPASVASRPATWNDFFEWDFAVDTFRPDLGSDYDNNGIAQDKAPGSTIAGNVGIMMYLGSWGVGLSVVAEDRKFELSTMEPGQLSAQVFRLALARSFRDGELSLGASVTGGELAIAATDANGKVTTSLVQVDATAFELGALWRPRGRNFRVGARYQPPLGASLDHVGCDPLDCGGYILPERVEFPWNLGVGVAWQRGPTPWNIAVFDDWRDEKSLVLAADLILSGRVSGGAGIESFLAHQLQPSGRDLVVSLRGGAEYEWVPGWFRVRGGLYWEPGRFAGVGGRAHATLGFDVRVWSFCFWGDRYRLRLSAASDIAAQYTNLIGSLGFWH